jgi:hypothetical protein
MDVAFWNNRYATAGYVYGEAPNGFLAEAARHIPVGPVLCLAEGEGRNDLLMTMAGLREELAGLELLIGWEIEREIIEGIAHTGYGAVVQVLAHRKS